MAGVRAGHLTGGQGRFALAQDLAAGRAVPLGEAFRYISGLYFRGKLAYADAFARPPAGRPDLGALVIVPGAGLLPPATPVTLEDLARMGQVAVHADNPAYRRPLEDAARDLAAVLGPACDVVLLGSVATPKYGSVLAGIFGERLMFPARFAGIGDMSRGSLMLKAAASGQELGYERLGPETRHNPGAEKRK